MAIGRWHTGAEDDLVLIKIEYGCGLALPAVDITVIKIECTDVFAVLRTILIDSGRLDQVASSIHSRGDLLVI